MTRCAREYGDAVRYRLGGLTFYQFNHPDQIAAAIAVMSDHFLRPFYWTRPGKWLPMPVNLRFWAAVRRLVRVIEEMIRRGRGRDRDAGDVLSRLLADRRAEGSPMTDRQL